jgi:tetratricopeptide (TPR) repeat protein
MSRLPSPRAWLPALALLWACGHPGPALASQPAADRADMGVSLAMSGELSRAESLFVSMLSDTRGDARALNNLGNLKLLNGDLGVALAFYDRAARGDTADAGIQLNRATTLLLMGDDARANEAAAVGVKLAGGLENAQALLGLSNEPAPERADKKAYVNKSEIQAMLKNAASTVPNAASKPATGSSATTAKSKSGTAWRSAGPRAADQSDAANVLYWKR